MKLDSKGFKRFVLSETIHEEEFPGNA